MRSIWAAGLIVVALAGCRAPEAAKAEAGNAEAATPGGHKGEAEYCGGEAPRGTAKAYFERLDAFLAAGAGPAPLELYAETFTVVDQSGAKTYRREDLTTAEGLLLSQEEWRAIARQGVADLKSVGWRGCILGDGKAAFEIDAQGRFALRSFDRDRAWSPGGTGTSHP